MSYCSFGIHKWLKWDLMTITQTFFGQKEKVKFEGQSRVCDKCGKKQVRRVLS